MSRFFFLPLIFAAMVAGGCSKECDEPDIAKINALYFEMQMGGEDGFTQEELDEIFIVRFVPYSQPLIADTMYVQGNFPNGPGRFFINDEYPFLNFQSPYFTTYGYMIVQPSTGFVGNIENIKLKGEYDGDCNYKNVDKKFTFNGEDHNTGGGENYFVIAK